MAEYGRSVLAVRTPHQYQLDQDMRRRLATAHHPDDYVDDGGLARTLPDAEARAVFDAEIAAPIVKSEQESAR